jgi:integrase
MRLTAVQAKYEAFRKGNGTAAKTIVGDNQAINRLVRAVGDIQIERLAPGHIDTLIGIMSTGDGCFRYAPSTINLTKSILGSFFKWCRSRGFMGQNQDPIAGRRGIPIMPEAKLMIPLSDFDRVLHSSGCPRDKAVIAFGLFTMLRQSELIDLRVRDLDFQRGFLDVRRFKTYQIDSLPIAPDARVHFTEWITAYQDEIGPLPKDAYLIPSMETCGFQQYRLLPYRKIGKTHEIVRRVLERNGYTGDRIGVHVLRRSAARAAFDEMARDGYDGALRIVAAWLGHKNTATTELYLQLTEDRSQRDKKFSASPLYPSLGSSNVIALPARKEA